MRFKFGAALLALAPLASTAPAQFGDGSDGSSTISGQTNFTVSSGVLINNALNSGETTLELDWLSVPGGLAPGDEVLICTQGDSDLSRVGTYEFATIDTVDNIFSMVTLTLTSGVTNSYNPAISGGLVIVSKVPHFSSLTVDPAGSLEGSVVALRVNGTATVNGSISATATGYSGGFGGGGAEQGDSPSGFGTASNAANGGAGGGGTSGFVPSGGGGGGYGEAGQAGEQTMDGGFPVTPGAGGSGYGTADLAKIFGGSGGGSGAPGGVSSNGSNGGRGGGIVFIAAQNLVVNGSIEADGENGEGGVTSVSSPSSGGGGGAGGSVFIVAGIAGGSGSVTAEGGTGGAGGAGTFTVGAGGDGGGGRVRIDTNSGSAGSLAIGGASVQVNNIGSSVGDWTLY